MKKKRWKYVCVAIAAATLVSLLAVLVCHRTIKQASRGFVYSSVATVPYNEVGLLLGTVPVLQNGRTNLYFQYRIEAAATLYRAGKIKYVLVSGDNRRHDYNEPEEMKKALMAAGVPEDAIVMDYAGLRTLDSIIRTDKIFGQKRFTVISQQFHNERAVYIARRHGLEAVGFNARDVDAMAGFKTRLREGLARVKAVADILTEKQPRHLGTPVRIGH